MRLGDHRGRSLELRGWGPDLGREQGKTGEVLGPTCEWCRLAQGAIMRGGEGPGQAGAKGCGRSRGELLAQQPPLRVVSGQLPEPPLQRLPKQPQLLVGLGQLLLGLRWEKPSRAGGGSGTPRPQAG